MKPKSESASLEKAGGAHSGHEHGSAEFYLGASLVFGFGIMMIID